MTTSTGEGIRERKKRLMRQALSDAAATLFLDRGFDDVRVADVAAECGVSEKTVYNYFQTKEALVMDRLEDTADSLRIAAEHSSDDPVDVCLGLLGAESARAVDSIGGGGAQAARRFSRFGALVHQTPALRAYQSQMLDRFVEMATRWLCRLTARPPNDPQVAVAAQAVISLWRVQFSRLHLRLRETPTDLTGVRRRVAADVEEAAIVARAAVAVLETSRRHP